MTADADGDLGLGEVIGEREHDIALAIAAFIRAQVTRDYPPDQRPARRDAHPKAHGCVRAEFRVGDDLPAELAHGVFVPGKRYAAWIRFSNANGDPTRADTKGDARGMAIKLLGVPGDKLLPSERDAQTHDFVMIDQPVFLVDDPAHYLTFLRRVGSSHVLMQLLAPFALGLRGAWNAWAISRSKIASPLETRYWSATAYRLGTGDDRLAVKFSARPCGEPTATIPDGAGPGFLRDAMIAALAQREAQFDFLIQPRASDAMSVERSTVAWSEADAPFVKVATIAIGPQAFATPERDAFGDDLSFTPWHALPAHRPLGAVNRVRRVVYEEISRLRHELNDQPRREPTDP